mgnify:CR=1 FL=1
MDSAILSPVSPVDNFCPRLVLGTEFINDDNNLWHLFTACPRCPRQKMSMPKEKQFLPERVPVRFGWHKLQPWGVLLPCCWPALGRVRAAVRSIQLNALPGAGGQAARNPGLPCCLGRAVLCCG